MTDSLALQVDHAYKRYTADAWVLKGLNMAVPKGSIYALLGPSGCGKSTLFNCIVGQIELDSGAIAINCRRRNEIGYMPQSVALYLTMTISETFTYYGRMGNMNNREIADRTEKLSQLLDLPPINRVVETLSGGQQRRISLSVALINDPSLLLLDEPTVGLDPVLRSSIWNHLEKLAIKDKKTIIITTHYIEEARQANTVGMMRGGVLLCEENPEDLLKNNNSDSMEQVFVLLSTKQEEADTSNNNNYIESVKREKILIEDNRHKLQRSTFVGPAYVKAEVTKNVIFIWRNKPMLSLLVLLPLIVSYLFNFTIGSNIREVKFGVVNNEIKEGGIASCFSQTFKGCNYSQPLSCRVLKEIKKLDVKLVEFSNWSEAVEAARVTSDIWGVVEVPANYTESLIVRFDLNLNSPDYIVDNSEMYVAVDNSNYFMLRLFEIYFHQGFLNGMSSFFRDCGWPSNTFEIPIKFEKPVFGTLWPNLTHYVSSPLIILIIFYLPMAYTMGVILQEKLNGVLERSMAAGLQLNEVLLGHSLVQMAVLIVQLLVLMVVIYGWHGHPLEGSVVATFFLILLQGLSGLAFGFLIALAVDDVIAGSFLSIGSLFTYFFLSGSMWPLEGMNTILKTLKPVTPTSYSVEALRGLTGRGWPITHPVIYKGFISVSCWTISFITLALVITRLKKYLKKS